MVCLDTNVLAYAEGVNDSGRQACALDILARLPIGATVIPVQVLGELFRVLTRKAQRTPADARAAICLGRTPAPFVIRRPEP